MVASAPMMAITAKAIVPNAPTNIKMPMNVPIFQSPFVLTPLYSL